MIALPTGCLPGTGAGGDGEIESRLLAPTCHFFFAPTRLIFLIASGGRLLFSAISLHDDAARRFVAVEAAEQIGRRAAVGVLRAVFIDDVEKGELALGIGAGFLGKGGLSSIRAPLSNDLFFAFVSCDEGNAVSGTGGQAQGVRRCRRLPISTG